MIPMWGQSHLGGAMNGRQTHILLVDDEEDHIELVRGGLQGFAGGEFELQQASTLGQARDMLAASAPDLMIVDYRLPDGEGLELLPGNFEKREFPIIVMTGRGDQKLAVNALKSGAIDYVVKTEATMADMANICEHAMREWSYISERREALRGFDARDTLIKRIFQAAPTGIFMLVDQRIAFVNEHLCSMLGYTADELIGKGESMLFCDDQEFKRSGRVIYNQIGKEGVGSIETRFRKKDGKVVDVWLGAAPVDAADPVAGTTFTTLDITARKKAEANMRFLATHDCLTGLANRNLFLDRLSAAIAVAKRHQNGLAVMFIDLDNFKGINDSMGHEVGDVVLQQVATRISQCLRASDSTARFGGDEFLVLLPMTQGEKAAGEVAEKVSAGIKRGFRVADETVSIGCSIGIALFPEHADHPETLINLADAAMYKAKQAGNSAYHFSHRNI